MDKVELLAGDLDPELAELVDEHLQTETPLVKTVASGAPSPPTLSVTRRSEASSRCHDYLRRTVFSYDVCSNTEVSLNGDRIMCIVAVATAVPVAAMTFQGRATASPPAAQAPSVTAAAKAGPPDTRGEQEAPLTAKERLAASDALYGAAKSYRDEAVVTIDSFWSKPRTVEVATAFERDGRFRWQARCSGLRGGGKSTLRLTIWSADGKTFECYGTHGRRGHTDGLIIPGEPGLASCNTTAIIRLLYPAEEKSMGFLRATDLVDPVDRGTDQVDGSECWKIEGKRRFGNAKRTVWIDRDGLVRKFREDLMDPRSSSGARATGNPPSDPGSNTYIVTITVLIKPHINEPQIDDAKFEPEEEGPDEPEN